jgi:hypothetical protein
LELPGLRLFEGGSILAASVGSRRDSVSGRQLNADPLGGEVEVIKARWLSTILIAAGCSSTAPPITEDAIPQFETAFVCRVFSGVRAAMPDHFDITHDCIAIDPTAFRELLLSGVPDGDIGWGWKEGHLAIGRSSVHGDRYFIVRSFRTEHPAFVRPGLPGCYTVPNQVAERWNRLLLDPILASTPPPS